MSALDDRLRAGFATAFGGAPEGVARAPGRVNLIGEHTDYNDGFVLPVAIDAETRVAWRRAAGTGMTVAALDYGGVPQAIGDDGPRWAAYVRAVAAACAEAGIAPPGLEIAIAGDIPQGSGLSSSASLEVALVIAFAAAAGQRLDPSEAARIAHRAETEFVGVRCGIMDQLASAAGVAGAALRIDCRSLAVAPVALPDQLALLIVQSGVVRGLVDGAYNARRAECEAAARLLGVPALCDATLGGLEAARRAMPDLLYRRARHVITENERVHAAARALGVGDLAALGALMAASHASMRDDFAITVPPVDDLVAVLAEAIGEAGGARMTGGGFGGAVVALVVRDRLDGVIAAVRAGYRTPAGEAPQLMIAGACAGASIVA